MLDYHSELDLDVYDLFKSFIVEIKSPKCHRINFQIRRWFISMFSDNGGIVTFRNSKVSFLDPGAIKKLANLLADNAQFNTLSFSII